MGRSFHLKRAFALSKWHFLFLCLMNLSTPINFPPVSKSISYADHLVFLGSCFAENTGAWLNELHFDAAVNPTGISFNPISMAGHIRSALREEKVQEDALIFRNSQYVHLDFHSVFNDQQRENYLFKVNEARKKLRTDLLDCDTLFLTFGTAIAFHHVETGAVVNNCHKLDASLFNQSFLDETDMKAQMSEVLQLLQSRNPKIEIYLTVSPIRHLRHGAIDNQRSKARLIRLCEMLCAQLPRCTYIPVFEYVLDELRDYRFYRHDDMIHLSELGLNMVRDKIKSHYIHPSAYPMVERVEKWNRMKSHRLIDEISEEARIFQQKRDRISSELLADLKKIKR